MNEISLPAFHVTTTSTCPVKIDYRLGEDLRLYRQYYKQAYNAEVPDADLIREMARRFMESDREFQSFKSRESVSRKGRKPAVTGEGKTMASPAAAPSSAAASGR